MEEIFEVGLKEQVEFKEMIIRDKCKSNEKS